MKLEDNYMKQVRKLHWLEHFHIIQLDNGAEHNLSDAQKAGSSTWHRDGPRSAQDWAAWNDGPRSAAWNDGPRTAGCCTVSGIWPSMHLRMHSNEVCGTRSSAACSKT